MHSSTLKKRKQAKNLRQLHKPIVSSSKTEVKETKKRPLVQDDASSEDEDEFQPDLVLSSDEWSTSDGEDAPMTEEEEEEEEGDPEQDSIFTRPPIEPAYDSESDTELRVENTIGNVPTEWYNDYPHIGYDQAGQVLLKKGATIDELDKFLQNADDPNIWRTVRDELMQRNVVLSEEDLDIIRRLQSGHYTDVNYNPYPETVEYFTSQVMQTPVTGAPELKQRFIPSKQEAKRIMQMVRAIRKGLMNKQQPPKDPFAVYNIWDKADDEEHSEYVRRKEKRPFFEHIPVPKMRLPGHEESYNPPQEYLLDEEEKKQVLQQIKYDGKRRFIPQQYGSLRQVPAYKLFIRERFERCMEIYLRPRSRKHRKQIDPESLVPKLPDPKELEPFPKRLGITFYGHAERVRCLSIDPTGNWIVSGSDDGTVKMWMLHTGKCVYTWYVGARFTGRQVLGQATTTKVDDDELHNYEHEDGDMSNIVTSVEWNPNRDVFLFAAAIEDQVLVISPRGFCNAAMQQVTDQLVTKGYDLDTKATPHVKWERPADKQAKAGYLAVLTHSKPVKQVTWHKKGDYFATVAPDGSASKSVLVHQLSRHASQTPFRKLKGMSQKVQFHPTRPQLLLATQQYVRIYDLQKQAMVKLLQPSMKWISSMDIHPLGDNVIVGSYDKKLTWFDLDLSSRPYKVMRLHKEAIRSVSYHPRHPLFASTSDDGQIQIFHGQVFDDLLQNPLIVPVKILRGHRIHQHLGVLASHWHPTLPWLVTAGADNTLRLWHE